MRGKKVNIILAPLRWVRAYWRWIGTEEGEPTGTRVAIFVFVTMFIMFAGFKIFAQTYAYDSLERCAIDVEERLFNGYSELFEDEIDMAIDSRLHYYRQSNLADFCFKIPPDLRLYGDLHSLVHAVHGGVVVASVAV